MASKTFMKCPLKVTFTSSNETESAKSMKRLSVEMLLCYCTGENNHITSLMDHDTVNNVAISLLFKY